MGTARADTPLSTTLAGNPGTPGLEEGRSAQLGFMTFGDARQLIDDGGELQAVGLLRGEQLARADTLDSEQVASLSEAALALVDPGSTQRAADAGVRRQAVLALQGIGESAERVQALPAALRSQIFDVLATLPSLRENPRPGDTAHTATDYRLVEESPEIRLLADQAALLFAPHRAMPSVHSE